MVATVCNSTSYSSKLQIDMSLCFVTHKIRYICKIMDMSVISTDPYSTMYRFFTMSCHETKKKNTFFSF